MEEIVLKAQPRAVVGKQVKALRREGRLPAVIYGRTTQPISVTLDFRDASRILPTISSSHLIAIEVDGERHMALVREKQRDPVMGNIIHVDFMAVSMTERLRAQVMLVLEGESPAVEDLDGILVTGLEQLEVECLPRDLPERINVDISGLTEIGASLYVRDIVVPPRVTVLTDPEEVVVVITAPVAEEVIEEAEAGEAEPEVIERGKKEEEDY